MGLEMKHVTLGALSIVTPGKGFKEGEDFKITKHVSWWWSITLTLNFYF